jgi:O-antigen biosynthesis protein
LDTEETAKNNAEVYHGSGAEIDLERIDSAVKRYEAVGAISAATLLRLSRDKLTQIQAYFLPNEPINVEIVQHLAVLPSINILIPSIRASHATGGPNTAYILGLLLAKEGISVRFIATDLSPDEDISLIKMHISALTDLDPDELGVKFIDASNRGIPICLGPNDSFMATAWWTAHIGYAASELTGGRKIYYLSLATA